MELLERELKGYEIQDGEEVVVFKPLKDIIDPVRDTWGTKDGKNKIISETGMLKMIKFTKAIQLKPEKMSEPTKENDYRDAFMCGIQFPDGSTSYQIGEATKKTTSGISSDYKMFTAQKRGTHRAFLKSSYVGFFDVYSEEEADAFRRDDEFIGETQLTEMVMCVSLPDDDEMYPNALVSDVLFKHGDLEYLKKIWDSTKNSVIKLTIQQVMKIYKDKLKERSKENTKKVLETQKQESEEQDKEATNETSQELVAAVEEFGEIPSGEQPEESPKEEKEQQEQNHPKVENDGSQEEITVESIEASIEDTLKEIEEMK